MWGILQSFVAIANLVNSAQHDKCGIHAYPKNLALDLAVGILNSNTPTPSRAVRPDMAPNISGRLSLLLPKYIITCVTDGSRCTGYVPDQNNKSPGFISENSNE